MNEVTLPARQIRDGKKFADVEVTELQLLDSYSERPTQ
jgi:hypothetical protein